MKPGFKSTFFTIIAMGVGLVVLLGYFIELPFLVNLRLILTRWAIVLAGVALLVGILNLARVHWLRLRSRTTGWFFSLVLLVSLLATIGISGYFGPASAQSMWMYNHIQVPLETSLLGVTAILLVYAAARIFSRRFTTNSLLFIATVIVVLVGTISIPGLEFMALREIRSWVAQIWAGAGIRGILLGIALGTVATGIRVLVGADRPYEE